MITLDEIAIEHGTDKATVFTRTYAKPKGYTVHLSKFFEPLRELPIKLLEIGVGGGESIKTWLDYFTNAQIRGIDVVSNTNEWDSPGAKTHPRYQFLQGDQRDTTMFLCALANWGRDFDIIVDDGGHFSDTVIITFECLWPALKPGGYYCIEDLGVASTPGTVFVPAGWPNHLDWVRDKLHEMNKGSDIEALHYYPELCVMQKRV